MKQSEIRFTITLDEEKMPVKIDWHASDAHKESSARAIMISLWDEQQDNSLRIDLWTREMRVDQMKQFCHQNLVAMAETLERATSDKEAARAIRLFAEDFGERLKLLKKN